METENQRLQLYTSNLMSIKIFSQSLSVYRRCEYDRNQIIRHPILIQFEHHISRHHVTPLSKWREKTREMIYDYLFSPYLVICYNTVFSHVVGVICVVLFFKNKPLLLGFLLYRFVSELFKFILKIDDTAPIICLAEEKRKRTLCHHAIFN